MLNLCVYAFVLFLFFYDYCVYTYITKTFLYYLPSQNSSNKTSRTSSTSIFPNNPFPVQVAILNSFRNQNQLSSSAVYSIDSDRSSQPKSDTLRCRSTCSNAAMVSTNLARCRFRLNMPDSSYLLLRKRGDFLFGSSGIQQTVDPLVFFARQLYNTFRI